MDSPIDLTGFSTPEDESIPAVEENKYTLPETGLLKIICHEETDREGKYSIEPLAPGYGVTVGNSLRRVLLSSLEGSAVAAVRIDGVTHEFTTLPGMKEDVVELILNLKTLRVKLLGNEPTSLRLEAKGPGEVRASNFSHNSQVEIVDPDHYLATLDKQGKLAFEILIERGRGYVPTERKIEENRPLGTISVDSIFTPIKKIHYEVENTRVGGMTNFDKLMLDITTDGTVSPRRAISQAAQILIEHFGIVKTIGDSELSDKPGKKVKASAKKAVTKTEVKAEKPEKKIVAKFASVKVAPVKKASVKPSAKKADKKSKK